jgi:SAM-dependent methyltransferase
MLPVDLTQLTYRPPQKVSPTRSKFAAPGVPAFGADSPAFGLLLMTAKHGVRALSSARSLGFGAAAAGPATATASMAVQMTSEKRFMTTSLVVVAGLGASLTEWQHCPQGNLRIGQLPTGPDLCTQPHGPQDVKGSGEHAVGAVGPNDFAVEHGVLADVADRRGELAGSPRRLGCGPCRPRGVLRLLEHAGEHRGGEEPGCDRHDADVPLVEERLVRVGLTRRYRYPIRLGDALGPAATEHRRPDVQQRPVASVACGGMDHTWVLDEQAFAGVEHLDREFVVAYDRKQGTAPDEAAAEDLVILRSYGVGARSTVVDLGAGTGRFVATIAPHVGRVIAVDVSAPMLERLQQRLDAVVGTAEVEVVRSGLLRYEHQGEPADAVHCRNVLHQLPDAFKALALHRIAQMLRPGGVLRLRDLVYDTIPDRFAEHLEGWFAGAVDDPAVGYTAEDLAQHVRTEHSTFTWLLEPMLLRAGFEIVDRSVHRGAYAAYTCIRRPSTP